MFHSGQFVAEHITNMDGSTVQEDAIQTHGVELGIDEIYRLKGPSFIGNEGYVKPERTAVNVRSANESGSYDALDDDSVKQSILTSDHYVLQRSNYVVKYDKKVHIPDDTVAFVFPRSRLMRSGQHLETAVWESGYEGEGEGSLFVDNQLFLKADTRIGQMVMARAEVLEEYDGSHQHENLEE